MELTPEEIAEIEKKERIAGYKSRAESLVDIHGLAKLAGWPESNPMKRLIDDIDSDSEAELLVLENKVSMLQEEASKASAKEQRKLIAVMAKEVCDSVLLLIGGWTVELNMPQNDVDTMIMNHQPLYEALKAGRATKAHGIISAMAVDAQVSQAMIDDMLEEFAQLGL